MVYVDEIFQWPIERTSSKARAVARRHNGKWCHLWCDEGDEELLHKIAMQIGLKREWFQDKPGFPHYDLVPTKRAAALRAGAKPRTLREWLMERRRGRKRSAE